VLTTPLSTTALPPPPPPQVRHRPRRRARELCRHLRPGRLGQVVARPGPAGRDEAQPGHGLPRRQRLVLWVSSACAPPLVPKQPLTASRSLFGIAVAQNPWIQNATLRDNILFGDATPDEARLREAISSCALDSDIAMRARCSSSRFPPSAIGGPADSICLPTPAQSLTACRPRSASEVRHPFASSRWAGASRRRPSASPLLPGINLSGGQKARACLARCVYSDADICFLDDPVCLGRPVIARLLPSPLTCGPPPLSALSSLPSTPTSRPSSSTVSPRARLAPRRASSSPTTCVRRFGSLCLLTCGLPADA